MNFDGLIENFQNIKKTKLINFHKGTTTPPSTSTTGFTTTEQSTTSQPTGRKLFRSTFHNVISVDKTCRF